MTSAASRLKRKEFTHVAPFQLGGGVTIDTATGQYDNGFLACARTGWPNPKSDSTFIQAATNLASYQLVNPKKSRLIVNTKMLVLAGHGNTGIISTGDGMLPRSAQGYISSSTYSAWAPSFANINGHGIFLTLCGCDCGGGVAGAQFLYQLATLLNMPVQGRTGLVYLACPGAIISYENGSVWQVAQPGVLPNPINPPSGSIRAVLPSKVWLKDTGEIPISSVESVAVVTPNGRTLGLSHERSMSLVQMANLDEPLIARGNPAAHLTGKIIMVVKNRRKTFQKIFFVYNDRLLRHEDDPTTYNRCAPSFPDEFRRISNQ
jgi:hypothetical protein